MRTNGAIWRVTVLTDDSAGRVGDQPRAVELIVVGGTLYPLLSRLSRDKIVEYEWQESEQGPPRKYYWLTTNGQSLLATLQHTYHRLHTSVKQLEKGQV